jgi:hypothetical protein
MWLNYNIITHNGVNVFENGITLPGRSEVSQAATTPCRLQLCTVSGCKTSKLRDRCRVCLWCWHFILSCKSKTTVRKDVFLRTIQHYKHFLITSFWVNDRGVSVTWGTLDVQGCLALSRWQVHVKLHRSESFVVCGSFTLSRDFRVVNFLCHHSV